VIPVPADLARAVIPDHRLPVSLVGTFFFMTMFGSLSTICRCSDSCWPSHRRRRMPSWWWRTSSAHCGRAVSGRRCNGAAWTRWARPDRHRARSLRRVRSSRFIPAFPAILPAVRPHHCGRHNHLLVVFRSALSPALLRPLLKPHVSHRQDRWWLRPVHASSEVSTIAAFEGAGRKAYGWLQDASSGCMLMLVVYAAVMGFGLMSSGKTPAGFIPHSMRLFDCRDTASRRCLACPNRCGQSARGGYGFAGARRTLTL